MSNTILRRFIAAIILVLNMGCDGGSGNDEQRIAVNTGPCGALSTSFSGSIVALGANGTDWLTSGWVPDVGYIESIAPENTTFVYTFEETDKGFEEPLLTIEVYVNQGCNVDTLVLSNLIPGGDDYTYRKTCNSSDCSSITWDQNTNSLQFNDTDLPYVGGARFGASGGATLSGFINW